MSPSTDFWQGWHPPSEEGLVRPLRITRASSQSHSTCFHHTARSQSAQGLVRAKISISTSWALTAYTKGAQYSCYRAHRHRSKTKTQAQIPMSWALRFVVTHREYETQQRSGYCTKMWRSALSMWIQMSLRHVENEKHGLLPNSLCTTARKALLVLAKCLMGENSPLIDGRNIQNFRPDGKQFHSNNKNGIGIPKSHIHVNNGQKSRLESWMVCTSKFRRSSDIFLSKKKTYHSHKTGSVHENGIISFW